MKLAIRPASQKTFAEMATWRYEPPYDFYDGDVDPVLSLVDSSEESVVVRMPRFDTPDGAAADLPRGVPARRVGGHLVTTVFDLLLAQYGVVRSAGGQRRYSSRQLGHARRLVDLVAEGLSLQAATRIAALEDEVAELRTRLGDGATGTA